ncbi:transketolase [Streptomyces sp. NPDC046853]|uniref:transketolase n=1 Tax=Streptomyces sp. NPDC046853 TaxID=3154920 RepID=UPI0033F2805F
MGATTVRAEDIYREELAKIGADDGRVVCVEALPGGAHHPFESAHPDRFFPLGGVESAMVTMVEGLVTAGFRVFVCGLGLGADTRAARLPRLTVAYLRAGASVMVPHTQTDLAELRSMPRVQIAVPTGAREIRAVLRSAARSGRPCHIRIGTETSDAVAAPWPGAADGDIPSVIWDVAADSGDPAETDTCLVSIGEEGTRLALAVRERSADLAHAHLVYLDDSHLAAAAGELALRHGRLVVLGGAAGPDGAAERLSRLLPGCTVIGLARPEPGAAFAADVERALSMAEGSGE